MRTLVIYRPAKPHTEACHLLFASLHPPHPSHSPRCDQTAMRKLIHHFDQKSPCRRSSGKAATSHVRGRGRTHTWDKFHRNLAAEEQGKRTGFVSGGEGGENTRGDSEVSRLSHFTFGSLFQQPISLEIG